MEADDIVITPETLMALAVEYARRELGAKAPRFVRISDNHVHISFSELRAPMDWREADGK